MGEVINPWFLYIIMQADSVLWLCGFFIVIGMITLITSLTITLIIASIVSYRDLGEEDTTVKKWSEKVYKNSMRTITLCAVLYCMIPSTKSLCVIYIVPKIANNEEVRGEFKELYDVAKQELKNRFITEGNKNGK